MTFRISACGVWLAPTVMVFALFPQAVTETANDAVSAAVAANASSFFMI